MSYSTLLASGGDLIRCKATDGNFGSGLKVTNTAGEEQRFIQTAFNDLLLEQVSSAGVVISTTNLTSLSQTGTPQFEGVLLSDPTLVGETGLTATATGDLVVSKVAPAPPGAPGAGGIQHGDATITDATGAGSVVLATTAGGDFTFTQTLPAPKATVSLVNVAGNAIGANPGYAKGALIATGVLTLNGGGGAQSVAVPEIEDSSTVAVAVSQHLSAANTANYAVGAPSATVGFDITSTGATDLDEVRWWVYNT
jgi:hypothetical protein